MKVILILKLLFFIVLPIGSIGAELIRADVESREEKIWITIYNNTKDYLFLSDPDHYGLTILTENGGQLLGSQSFDHKNRKLIFLSPNMESSNSPRNSFMYSFRPNELKGDLEKILLGKAKVVVWVAGFKTTIQNKAINMERLEVVLSKKT